MTSKYYNELKKKIENGKITKQDIKRAQAKGFDINEADPTNWGNTLLMCAAMKFDKKAIKILADCGADLDVQDDAFGCTACMDAAMSVPTSASIEGKVMETIELLVMLGADIYIPDNIGRILLDDCFTKYNEKAKRRIIEVHKAYEKEFARKFAGKLLLDENQKLKCENRQLCEELASLQQQSAKNGKTQESEVEASIDGIEKRKPTKFYNELKKKIENGTITEEDIKRAQAKGFDINEIDPDHDNYTLLLCAAYCVNIEAIKILANCGANLNVQDSDRGCTACMTLAIFGQRDWLNPNRFVTGIKFLVASGADICIPDDEGRIVLGDWYIKDENTRKEIYRIYKKYKNTVKGILAENKVLSIKNKQLRIEIAKLQNISVQNVGTATNGADVRRKAVADKRQGNIHSS